MATYKVKNKLSKGTVAVEDIHGNKVVLFPGQIAETKLPAEKLNKKALETVSSSEETKTGSKKTSVKDKKEGMAS